MRLRSLLALAVLCALIVTIPVVAQDEPPADQPVTLDEVNDVARRLYCPVCENEPLDTCMATTCVEWRDEIRQQLAQGYTPDEVVQSFVDQHGDRVLPVPESSSLRLVTFVVPALAVLVGGGFTFWFLNTRRTSVVDQSSLSLETTINEPENAESDYRSRLEDDLKGP